ncbi:bromodomain-containing protein 7 isoform X1 [Anguilla anguilla]|uniref:bromodomain-containing protein 7 isoform X1 n=1 Tax=Anguilla anguilla TaxID=7936 RepID=UPI0015AAD9F8|nr:bromodomain-containing protein 7 isoform X1 [Anguilla anguilla]XP_035251390.1 bromodomain-containing protein 7 isoform X1 [Anguilla anguilla]
MGKKHKKHKSEKHAYEEYVEKPLKLVLKVAGNEVTELSTGSSSHDNIYEDKTDYDKHKDKKKKKKKKGEKERNSPVQSGDEKKKKKTTKKKKGQDSMDTDWDDRERSHTPIRSDLSQDKHLTPSIAKMDEKEQTPLQEALNQLIRQLQRKDPNAFFAFPVTDFIAPGYSLIIKRPMDFSTMKDKVKKEYYQALEELKADFKIMCENAMIYNKPETIYYKAAKKLLHSGMKILSPERLQSLRQSIEFMADVESTTKEQGEAEKEDGAGPERSADAPVPADPGEAMQSPRRISKDTPRQDRDSKDEALKAASQAEKELEQIRKIIEDSGGKLSNRDVLSELEFDRRKPDGTTSLGILNAADLSAGDSGYCPVKLGMMMGRLQTGINTLQGFKEDKRNKVTPVSYMNYGPYSSYAPVYDSSFANISKEDSDLIYSNYGDESSLQGQESLPEFLTKTDEYMDTLADNMLDTLTGGEHSRSLKEMETEPQSSQSEEEVPEESEPAQDVEIIQPESSSKTSLTSLSSVTGLGLDLEPETLPTEEARQFQQKLDETTVLLRELQEVQNERLSTKPPPNIICLLAPSARELQLAEKVTENLAHLASQVNPGDISSVYGIRKAMGISLPEGLQEDSVVDLTTVAESLEPEDALPENQEEVPVLVV